MPGKGIENMEKKNWFNKSVEETVKELEANLNSGFISNPKTCIGEFIWPKSGIAGSYGGSISTA